MNKTGLKSQRGYSLIELLIATSIVATLVAVAIPVYTNFMTRAKLVEPIATAVIAKNAVVEYYYVNGRFPRNNAQAGLSRPVDYRSDYVRRMTVNRDGQIIVVLRGSLFRGHSIIFQGTETDKVIIWECTSTLPQIQLPTSCTSTER